MPSTKRTHTSADNDETRSVDSLHLKLMAKAAGLSLAAMVFSKFASYAFRWVGAMLGTEQYGAFAMAFGVFEIAAGLALFGIDSAVARFVVDDSASARKGSVRYNSYWYGSKVAICLSITASVLLGLLSRWIASDLLHIPQLWTSLVLFAAAMPFFILVLVFVAAARGLKHIEYEAGAKSVLESGMRPMVAFAAIAMGFGMLSLPIAVLASSIIVFVVCIYWARKLFRQDWLDSLVRARRPDGFFRFSLPLYASNLLSILMANASLFSLGLIIGTSQAGVFSALLPLAIFIIAPATGMLSIFVSVGSELHNLGRTGDSERLYQSLVKAILMVTLPVSVLLAFFSREALTFLYVIDYSSGALALSVLALAYLVYSTFLPALNYLQVLKRTDVYMWNMLSASVAVFAAIYLFVPTLGTNGAAIAFSVGLVLQSVLPAIEVYWFSRIQPIGANFLLTLAAGVIAFIPLYFLNGAFGLRAFPRVAFGAFLFCAAYATLLFFLRAFDRDDIELLKAAERKSGFKLGVLRVILKKLYFGKNA
ncbi:MAG: oligosaccharide flippase family protein [Candidatus Micrarchaeia archaeon]